MTVKLKNERWTRWFEFGIEGLEPEDAKRLRNYGWEEIQKDDDALINYGFMRYMQEFALDVEKNLQYLEKMIKDKKKRLDVQGNP